MNYNILVFLVMYYRLNMFSSRKKNGKHAQVATEPTNKLFACYIPVVPRHRMELNFE